MAYQNQNKCEGCGISIPEVHEDQDPAAQLCDTCYDKAVKHEPRLEDYKCNFREEGLAFVVRCPSCSRENYGGAVARGQCAWCHWEADKGKEKNGVDHRTSVEIRTR